MYRTRNSRRRSLNTHAAQVSSEKLETRQLLSADGLTADCADGQNDQQPAGEGISTQSEASQLAENGGLRQDAHTSMADYDALLALIAPPDTDSVVANEDRSGDRSGDSSQPTVPAATFVSPVDTVCRRELLNKVVGVHDQRRPSHDLQVAVEVRFLTVSDEFFEQLGTDFDFDVEDLAGEQPRDAVGGETGNLRAGEKPLGGQVQPPGSGFGALDPGDVDDVFSGDSSEGGVPDFGGFDGSAGAQVGTAILSDIEVFFLVQASQGDQRTNLLSRPKVTLFDGQAAAVRDFAYPSE